MTHQPNKRANKTDAGNGSNGICRVIDWTLRESSRAKIKVMVKRILNKHGYWLIDSVVASRLSHPAGFLRQSISAPRRVLRLAAAARSGCAQCCALPVSVAQLLRLA